VSAASGDLIFGLYHLAQHHVATQATDAIQGPQITDAALLEHLLLCVRLSAAMYKPSPTRLMQAIGCQVRSAWPGHPCLHALTQPSRCAAGW
jgi:hypothetical protein